MKTTEYITRAFHAIGAYIPMLIDYATLLITTFTVIMLLTILL